MANLVGWIGLMVWLAWCTSVHKLNLDPIALALLLFVSSMALCLLATEAWQTGQIKVGVWLGYLAFYYLARQWSDETIHRAATWAFIPYALISLFHVENANVLAFNLVGLALLSGLPLLIAPAGLIAAGWLSSIGGLLASGLGATCYTKRPGLLALGLVPVGLIGWLVNPAGYAWRLQFWADAWQGFLSSPLVGLGPGMYYTLNDWPHAHNILATTAAEGGVIGLAALGLLIWAVTRRWAGLPSWAAAVILAFGAWSLVDEPLHFWGPGFIFFTALSRLEGVPTYATQIK
jgi:hypothetical protein